MHGPGLCSRDVYFQRWAIRENVIVMWVSKMTRRLRLWRLNDVNGRADFQFHIWHVKSGRKLIKITTMQFISRSARLSFLGDNPPHHFEYFSKSTPPPKQSLEWSCSLMAVSIPTECENVSLMTVSELHRMCECLVNVMQLPHDVCYKLSIDLYLFNLLKTRKALVRHVRSFMILSYD